MLWNKYGEIFALLIMMDEFMFLISKTHMMRETDLIIYNRYVRILAKCKEDPSNPESCLEVCQEFNLNRFTYLWDGEAEAIKTFIESYESSWQKLETEEYA